MDTNVLVSALIGKGKPGALWRAALERRFTPVTSMELLEELLGVLERKKFEDMGKKQVERFVRQIIRISVITPVKSSYKVVREDPEDDVVINTAYAGRAKYIVTGDSHLLKIAAFKGIKIVSIGSFLEML